MNVFRFLKLKKKPIKKCAHLSLQFRFLFHPLSGLNQQPNEEIQKKYGRHR